MRKIYRTTLFGALLTLAISSTASAVVIDFESGTPSNFAGGIHDSTDGYEAYGFGESFLTSDSEITFSVASSPSTINLEFDLAIINSWDGSLTSVAPDYFNVTINGVSVFKETFDNFSLSDQSYTGTPIVYDEALWGSNTWNDSAYHITLNNLSYTGSSLEIKWFADGAGWQASTDESFGIDNVTLTFANAVPEPTTMLLFGTGLAGLAGYRRKQQK